MKNGIMTNTVLVEIRCIAKYVNHCSRINNELQTKNISHTRLSRNSYKYQAK